MMVRENFLDQRQADPLAVNFGAEKRDKQICLHLRADIPQPVSSIAEILAIIADSGTSGKFAASLHGLQRILENIDQDLFHLIPVQIDSQLWHA